MIVRIIIVIIFLGLWLAAFIKFMIVAAKKDKEDKLKYKDIKDIDEEISHLKQKISKLYDDALAGKLIAKAKLKIYEEELEKANQLKEKLK